MASNLKLGGKLKGIFLLTHQNFYHLLIKVRNFYADNYFTLLGGTRHVDRARRTKQN